MTTEHDQGFTADRLAEYREACARASSDRLLIVPGMEYSDADNRIHILVWGPVPFLGEAQSTISVLEAVAAHGGIAVFAHARRRNAWQCVEPNWIERLWGIEIWNRKYDGFAPGQIALAMRERSGCTPFVGLDFHTSRQLFPLTMTLEMADPINEDNAIDCLRQRRCSPSAFGLPLLDDRFQLGLPLLRLAELGRSRLAAAKRFVVDEDKSGAPQPGKSPP
jgi:hypothetical protein